MFEIFGSAIPAVDDLKSRLWIVEVAKSEGLGFTSRICRVLHFAYAVLNGLLQPAERFWGVSLILRYQWGPKGGR
jgi:hypothetical protein